MNLKWIDFCKSLTYSSIFILFSFLVLKNLIIRPVKNFRSCLSWWYFLFPFSVGVNHNHFIFELKDRPFHSTGRFHLQLYINPGWGFTFPDLYLLSLNSEIKLIQKLKSQLIDFLLIELLLKPWNKIIWSIMEFLFLLSLVDFGAKF